MTSSRKLMEACLKELTYKIPPTRRNAVPEIISDVVRIGDTVISIPVARTDLIPDDYLIKDKRTFVETTLPAPNIILREDQIDVYDKVEDNCLINAKPGWGKTFCGLHILKKLGQKSLVVVHNTALRDQWQEETFKLFGFTPGIIGTGRFETDTPIVISNIQTLRKHISKYSNMFGAVICDECHRIPSSTFKYIIDALTARYKIGLSATIGRKDNKHIIIPDYFSNTTYVPETDTAMKPVINCLYTNIKLDHKLGHWVRKVTALCDNPEYRELVTNLVDIKSNVEKRKTLIVADRLNFLQECGSLVDNAAVVTSYTKDRPAIHRKIYKDKLNSIWGTTSIYKEGISINPLSCLVLGCPINNRYLLEQIVGRVTRPHPDKPTPEVWDIVLADRLSRQQFSERLNYYMSKGYEIKEIHL